MKFYRAATLSPAAADLVEFDRESILQVVSSKHLSDPDIWLADPDAYEKNGRILRDSASARMLAYSTKEQMLYATDGCNSCARQVPAELEQFSSDRLDAFARDNEIRPDLLTSLAGLLK